LGAKNARQLLQQFDLPLLTRIRASAINSKGLVPVVITGARESLVAALTRGLAAALEASNANGARRLAREIRESTTDARRDPIKMLGRAVSCLTSDARAFGALIIIDELGKLLEYAAANPNRSDVYLLQRLAEYVARAETPTLLIGVLHQDFSGYAHELSETERQEWGKVRGRFEDIVFEQSADDMLRLIAGAMSARGDGAARIPDSRSGFKSLSEVSWTAKIVPPGLEPRQGLPLLAACYPLHPCVTLLLGPIFKRFGQNERSAFSFLSSGEPHALAEFTAKARPGELYCVFHLYEYLVGVFGDSLLASKDGKRWAEAFNVESQHSDLAQSEINLLRTIALLGIVGRWNGIAPTPDVLRFALSPSMAASEVESATKSLIAKSAIVYRRFNDTYNLWEGSDIDVEARISDARSRIASDASTVHLLREHFTPRPLVARRHSFESGTLRYFDVVFATGATLGDLIVAFDGAPCGTRSDGLVVVMLPDARGCPVSLEETSVRLLAGRRDIVLCIPGNAREIETLARELSAVRWVREATADLQNDATARRELAAREEDVRGRLQQAVVEILAPARSAGPKTRWLRMGEEQKLTTARALNELLSISCDEYFHSAPIIQNEIINRRELSSSAAAAQRNLIDHMLRHSGLDGLAIEGNPPERSIYLSVLRGLNLHQEHQLQWTFASSEKSVRKDAQPTYRAIREFFQTADAAPRGIDELFRLLQRPPFGLRNGVIPIFVCAALLGNESDVALYEDGGFLPQLTDAVFEKLIKDPSRYTVRLWHVTGVRVTVFEQLAKMLGQSPITDRIEARDMLGVVKPLVRFVRKLNDFTRQTKTFAPVTIAVREAIANASEPDHLLFHDLPRACGVEPFAASKKDRSEDIKRFLRVLQGSLNELQRGYDVLLRNLTDKLAESLEVSDQDQKPRTCLARRAMGVTTVALSPEIKVFTSRIADAAADDDTAWIEQIASFLANKHPTLWHDDDRNRFTVRLSQMADAFRSLESLVLARKDLRADEEQSESIRISVVGTRSPQTDHVVHLNVQEAEKVRGLESKLTILFEPYSCNGSRKLVLAALARVAQTILNNGTTFHQQGLTK
jgi:hypothetical protein